MKIVAVVGARPQFIKHAILSRELSKAHQIIVIHTGQHYDEQMSAIFFKEMNIPEPDYNLGVGSGSHAYQTGNMMKGIEDILKNEYPGLVLIYGDTNSTLAGALAARKIHLKLSHVEAGLRTYDKTIPEEINRVIADYCADYLFCPTPAALENLKCEHITKGVYLTGDVMVDALKYYEESAERSVILERLQLASKQYILVTLHRAANTDIFDNLKGIIEALLRLADNGETIVFPIHPRTSKIMESQHLLGEISRHLKIIGPQGYLDFLKLMNHSRKIITDSGGIQKEAYILRVPCITLMDKTTWGETVEDGWNVLAGTNSDIIVQLATSFTPTSKYSDRYGTNACQKIARIIESI